MKEKIMYIIKLFLSLILFFYISTILKVVLQFFDINVSSLSLKTITFLEFLISFIICLISSIIYFKELKKDYKEFKVNIKKRLLFSLKLFGIFILIKFISSYISSYLSVIFNIELTTSENQEAINGLLKEVPLLIFFSSVILAPIYEEIIFRLGFKKCLNNRILFVIVSGAIFGLMHIFPTDLNIGLALLQSIPYVTMGIVLAYFYMKYDNIFYSIMIHLYNNLFSIIVMLIYLFLGL